jgi:hypothetical protein
VFCSRHFSAAVSAGTLAAENICHDIFAADIAKVFSQPITCKALSPSIASRSKITISVILLCPFSTRKSFAKISAALFGATIAADIVAENICPAGVCSRHFSAAVFTATIAAENICHAGLAAEISQMQYQLEHLPLT